MNENGLFPAWNGHCLLSNLYLAAQGDAGFVPDLVLFRAVRCDCQIQSSRVCVAFMRRFRCDFNVATLSDECGSRLPAVP